MVIVFIMYVRSKSLAMYIVYRALVALVKSDDNVCGVKFIANIRGVCVRETNFNQDRNPPRWLDEFNTNIMIL